MQCSFIDRDTKRQLADILTKKRVSPLPLEYEFFSEFIFECKSFISQHCGFISLSGRPNGLILCAFLLTSFLSEASGSIKVWLLVLCNFKYGSPI